MRLTKIPTLWHPDYHNDAAPLTSTTKQRRVVTRAGAMGLLDLRYPTELPPTVWADVAKTHDPAFVAAVRTGEPRPLAESQGFTWSPGFARATALIWHGQMQAAALARTPGVGLVLHPASGAHHAGYARGGGFCTFNFLVGAAAAHLPARPLILDFDAHEGDGTLALLDQHGLADQIGVFDIYGGDRNQTRISPDKRQTAVEVRDSAEYLRALWLLPAVLDALQPGLVFYQAGVDAHEADPVGGIKGVARSILSFRDRYVIEELVRREIPTVVNLAGGYDPELSVTLHVDTVLAMHDAMNPQGVRR